MIQEHDGEAPHTAQRRELLVLLTLSAVQFAVIVDFMIVMPLGPQLMRPLHIGPARFGLTDSSFALAAGTAGLVASSIVDRFSRRTAAEELAEPVAPEVENDRRSTIRRLCGDGSREPVVERPGPRV